MTDPDVSGDGSRSVTPLAVFNAIILGAGSLYQATGSVTVTMAATTAAALCAGWAIWFQDRTRQQVRKRIPVRCRPRPHGPGRRYRQPNSHMTPTTNCAQT